MAVDIIDSVLEDIRLGMESLNHRTNQRRTAMVKFLGEMYNYRLIDSALVFKVLKGELLEENSIRSGESLLALTGSIKGLSYNK